MTSVLNTKEAATSTFPDNLDRVLYNDYVLQVIVLQGTLQVTISGVNIDTTFTVQ
jgi:hypothetical protein